MDALRNRDNRYPDVLIADEPTTALDVTVQAQIMDLLAEIQAERHMGAGADAAGAADVGDGALPR